MHMQRTTEVVKDTITPDMFHLLAAEFTTDEVTNAISSMKGLAAPGPDGLPAIFYHTYWEIINKDVINTVLQVLNNKEDPSPLNDTYICLIPKNKDPTHPGDFRPISLCNVILKIITKTMANRLKLILPDVISQNQSAFVPGRMITDNTLVAYEVFHFFNQSTSKKGYMGIKTDMAKAYDRVEWPFLQTTLETMGFPQHMTDTIMRCVRSVSFSILLNGKPTKSFKPKKGSDRETLSLLIFLFYVQMSFLASSLRLKWIRRSMELRWLMEPLLLVIFFLRMTVYFFVGLVKRKLPL
jgi:hypothetical protein